MWNIISELYLYGLSIQYVCFEGGSSNRAFHMMHFKNKLDAFEKNFTTVNPFYPSESSESVSLIMDFSHNITKIRNNIFSSGDNKLSTRK